MKNKNKWLNIFFVIFVILVLGIFIKNNFIHTPIPEDKIMELPKKGKGKNELKIVLEYACHFARNYYLEVLKENEQNLLKNDIHIIYDVVSLNYTEPSFPAVKAVYCANEQNKFFELNEIFFNKANEADTIKDVFTTENILSLAKQIGLNKNFEKCFLSDKYDEYIYNHSREYISNLEEGEGFGFPSTYINEKILTKKIDNQDMPLGYTPFNELNDIIKTNLK